MNAIDPMPYILISAFIGCALGYLAGRLCPRAPRRQVGGRYGSIIRRTR